MKIEIEIDEAELKLMVFERFKAVLGPNKIRVEDIKIEVKSKQNYKSEWEPAAFRARVEKHGA